MKPIPCPLCNHKPHFKRIKKGKAAHWQASCDRKNGNHAVQVRADTKEEATLRWNIRPAYDIDAVVAAVTEGLL